MNEETIKTLTALRDAYQKIRTEKLAKGIVINTLIGDYEITNQQIVATVLDLLIHEANEGIRKEVDR